MNRSEAAQMMARLMTDFNLPSEWTFEWMRRRNTLGLCKHGSKVLLLSTLFVDHNDEDTVEQVCRHEIAHALAGPREGHNDYWKAIAIQCGVRNPKATCDEAIIPPARYQTTCNRCGKFWSKSRAPLRHRQYWCPDCAKALGHLPHDERLKLCGLNWIDSRAPKLETVSRELMSASLSAEQNVAGKSAQASTESAPKRDTRNASELAAAMGVDPKTFRAWLRKNPDLVWEYKEGAGYQFDVQGIRTIVRLWNSTH